MRTDNIGRQLDAEFRLLSGIEASLHILAEKAEATVSGASPRGYLKPFGIQGFIAFAISLILEGQAAGLSYREHERISSLAFASAVEGALRDNRGGMLSADDVAALVMLDGDGDGLPVSSSRTRPGGVHNLPSYGELAAKVDYLLDEREYFIGNLQPCVGEWADLDLTHVAEMGQSQVDLLAATLRDETHFQAETLKAAALWHRQAMDFARRRRHCDLVGALARSAIAAHFLEDFLTPGHVFGSKDGRPATDTLTAHNWFNRGVRLIFTDHSWLEHLVSLPPSATVTRLSEELGCPISFLLAAWADRGIRVVGDWRLANELGSGLDEGREQQLFFVLLVSRMVGEVIEAYLGAEGESVLAPLRWPSGGAETKTGRYAPFVDLGPLQVRPEVVRLIHPPTYFALTLGLRAAVGSVSAPTGLLLQLETNDIIASRVFREIFDTAFPKRSAALFGLNATYDGRFWSVGAAERFSVALLPRIDLHGSVEGGFRMQSNGGALTTRGAYAARLEMGTGLAFVGIGCTWEHVAKGTNTGRSGLVVTSTVTWYDLGFFLRPTR